MIRRNRGALDQVIPPLEKGTFSRQWLDNVIGMKQLPVDSPRIPIAMEAHFARSCWGATGGPSYTAHHTGISATLELPPGMSFPAPDPSTWIFDFGDRLSAMKEPGWKEQREARSAKAKEEFKRELSKASPDFPEAQFEAVWKYRQHSQRFYGMVRHRPCSPRLLVDAAQFAGGLIEYCSVVVGCWNAPRYGLILADASRARESSRRSSWSRDSPVSCRCSHLTVTSCSFPTSSLCTHPIASVSSQALPPIDRRHLHAKLTPACLSTDPNPILSSRASRE